MVEKARLAEPVMTLLLSVVIMFAVANSLLQTALQAGFMDPLSMVVFTIMGFSGFLAAFSVRRLLGVLPSRRGFKLRLRRKPRTPLQEEQPTTLEKAEEMPPMEHASQATSQPREQEKPTESQEQPSSVDKEQEKEQEKTESSSSTAKEPPSPPVKQQAEKAAEAVHNPGSSQGSAQQRIDLSVIKELSYRVDTLEREFEQFRSDLADLVEGIESTLIDLRAAVSEISNPFNILRRYKEILSLSPPDERREEQVEDTETKELPVEPAPEEKAEELLSREESDLQVEKAAEELRSILKVERKVEAPRSPLAKIASEAFSAGISLGKLIKLIQWTGETLSLGRSRFLDVIDLCEETSMISPEIKALLLHVADYLESISPENLNEAVVEVCFSLYKLGKILGFCDAEAEVAVRSIMARRGCSRE